MVVVLNNKHGPTLWFGRGDWRVMSGIVPTINLKSFTEDDKTVLVEHESVDGKAAPTFESVKTTLMEHGNVVLFCPDHPNEGVKWADAPDRDGNLRAQCAVCGRDTLSVQARS